MYWVIAVVVVVALVFNSWWRRSIARNYRELIAEITEKRVGQVQDVTVAPRKRKKYPNARDREAQETVLWETDEGFPMDFSYTKKREKPEAVKFTLKSVVQDASGNVYLQGTGRKEKEERAIDVTTVASNVTLPMYKVLPLAEVLETVCGVRLHF